MKSRILTLTVLFAVVFFFSSCEDLLEKVPENQLTTATISSEENLQAALMGTYEIWQWHIVDGFHVFPMMFEGVRADDVNSNQQGFWVPGLEIERFPISVENQNVEKLWKKWYAGIGRANLVVEKSEEFTEWSSDALKNRIIGEAKFLRAFFYFELVRKFGGVPMLMEPVESLEDLPPLERATEAEIYAQIDKDLQEAIPMIPLRSELVSPEIGRAHRGTAQALLAKSKLYQQDWNACAQLCEEVINSGQYMLEPNFGDNFNQSTENGPESLFEIQFGDGFDPLGVWFETLAQGSDGSGMLQFSFFWGPGIFTTWGNMLPRGELKDLYDDADQRKAVTFMTTGDDLNSPFFESQGFSPLPESVFAGYDPDKFDANPNPNDFNYARKYYLPYEEAVELAIFQQSPLNEKVIRYAEVLLMHAEAAARGAAVTIAGEQSLNLVTDRAGIPNVPFTLDNVKLERRKELATEGWNRFSDLMRYKALGEGIPARLTQKGFVEGRDELLPIPQAEINTVSSAILKQNPGY